MRQGILTIALLCGVFYAASARADDLTSKLLAIQNNPPSAAAVFGEVVASDDPRQISALGVMLFDGIGVRIDHPTAMPFLEKAAALGRPEAQYRLGLAYSRGGQIFYQDPPVDEALAEQWMTKAATSATLLADNDPAAMMVLAHLKFSGRGGIAKDIDGAAALVRKAAERGYPPGATAYGHWLSRDLRRPVDREKLREATTWFAKAVIDGSSEAMEGMGTTYLTVGEPDKARPFLRRAAEMGREPASRYLYLRFKETVGNNIALEQDKIFDRAAAQRRKQKLVDTLTDPLVIAGSILALTAIIGIAAHDPDRPIDRNRAREADAYAKKLMDQQQKSFALVPCLNPASGRGWYGVGGCY